ASGTEHLYGLIQAIKNRHKIEISYRKFNDSETTRRVVTPYALKECRGRWYLLGYENGLKTFGLERIQHFTILHEHFRLENVPPVDELFRNSFGIILREDLPVEKIVLAFDQYDGAYLKSFPLHHSQKILTDNDKECVIQLELKITSDFIMEILSRSNSLQVIAPQSLKEHIHRIFEKAAERNKTI
ncbi:MAG: WYL domain-containing protein, partial [Oscillibacter sp.]|nr:WYL domain-containing protein [Oscillibacter sp.]